MLRTLRDRERGILESYVAAIDAAREWIYVENQFFFAHKVFERMDAALRRGVDVVVVVPGRPLPEVFDARRRHPQLFAAFEALARHERFTLASLAWMDASGNRHDVYVHSKLMIVDDAWMTVGSANLEKDSLNAPRSSTSRAGTPASSTLRRDLFEEHAGASAATETPRRWPRPCRRRATARCVAERAARPIDAASYALA